MITCDADFELKATFAPTAIVLAALRHRTTRWREEALCALTSGCGRRPFVVVTPRGRADADLLAERFEHLGVKVTERESVAAWPEVSASLGLRLNDDATLLKAFGMQAAWAGLYESAEAERWNLATERDLGLVLANEREFRELVPSIYGRVASAGSRITVGLHAIYVPRAETWALESATLDIAGGRVGSGSAA